jgi:hypothetical protein
MWLVCVVLIVSSQSAQERKLADSREVSEYWGGNASPDGSAKKANKYVTAGDQLKRGNELRQERTSEKQAVRARFLLHREAVSESRLSVGVTNGPGWMSVLSVGCCWLRFRPRASKLLAEFRYALWSRPVSRMVLTHTMSTAPPVGALSAAHSRLLNTY